MPALDGVDLSIKSGEFVTITGPSGCGKTTLLQLVGALDLPTSGTIEVDGLNLGQASESERNQYRRERVGIIFQFFNLLPTMSVEENVALPLRLNGKSHSEIQNRLNELIPRVGLRERAKHLPHQLSGGEMQRVALARALAHQPKVLLADEPTGNLDSANASLVMDLINQIHQEEELTLLLVTHSEQVAQMGTRRIQMRDGQIESRPPQS